MPRRLALAFRDKRLHLRSKQPERQAEEGFLEADTTTGAPASSQDEACVECESNAASRAAPLYDVEIQDMDLNGMLEPMEEGTGAQVVSLTSLPLEMAMEDEEAGESRDQLHRAEAEAQETS
uniref:Uncharacterized protein n=1 Tax=Micrurus surinamensis TaxID=129470 RepID=A0A2D4PJF3_MICSU